MACSQGVCIERSRGKDLHAPRGGSVGRREVVIYRYLQPAVPKLCYMLGR